MPWQLAFAGSTPELVCDWWRYGILPYRDSTQAPRPHPSSFSALLYPYCTPVLSGSSSLPIDDYAGELLRLALAGPGTGLSDNKIDPPRQGESGRLSIRLGATMLEITAGVRHSVGI